jgi:dihydrofolate reductase
MRRIFLFMNTSLDGYIEAPGHDLSWAKNDFEAFSPGSSQGTGTILLGRRTFEMMRAFWPTPQAAQMVPEVARFMNATPKVAVSHAPFDPAWDNSSVISTDAVAGVAQLKAQPGKDIILLGSNTLATSLLQAGLLDEIQIMLNPVVIGAGTPLFQGLPLMTHLALKETQRYPSGNVLLTYAPE